MSASLVARGDDGGQPTHGLAVDPPLAGAWRSTGAAAHF